MLPKTSPMFLDIARDFGLVNYLNKEGAGGSSAQGSQSSGPIFLTFPTLGSTRHASRGTRDGLKRSVGGLSGSTGASHLS